MRNKCYIFIFHSPLGFRKYLSRIARISKFWISISNSYNRSDMGWSNKNNENKHQCFPEIRMSILILNLNPMQWTCLETDGSRGCHVKCFEHVVRVSRYIWNKTFFISCSPLPRNLYLQQQFGRSERWFLQRNEKNAAVKYYSDILQR